MNDQHGNHLAADVAPCSCGGVPTGRRGVKTGSQTLQWRPGQYCNFNNSAGGKMTIKINKLNMIWSVIWTLDNGESWRAMAFDTFGDALNLAARIGSMQCSL